MYLKMKNVISKFLKENVLDWKMGDLDNDLREYILKDIREVFKYTKYKYYEKEFIEKGYIYKFCLFIPKEMLKVVEDELYFTHFEEGEFCFVMDYNPECKVHVCTTYIKCLGLGYLVKEKLEGEN